jgi:2-polyprenyl-3-methyl-5-hydroxy-6-metoxy-1,4-benzoquinol methylase
MDLGCGNGMLLRYIKDFLDKPITPYGIDISDNCITLAKNKIFPDYSENFRLCDVNDYDFKEGPFDVIITNPFYSKDIRRFTEQCLTNLNKNGQLIYRLHRDVLRYYEREIEDNKNYFQSKKMRYVQTPELSIGIFNHL